MHSSIRPRWQANNAKYLGTLQWDGKVPLPVGDLDPHLTNGSFGTPESKSPSAISIGSTVFAVVLTNLTNRETDKHTHEQTDHATPSVAIGRI